MCTVVRGDLPVSIRWFKDGRQLSVHNQLQDVQAAQEQQLDSLQQQQQQPENRASSSNIVIKQLDPYSSTLTFASLQPSHRGLYTCEATNEVGRANQSSQLVIHGKCCVVSARARIKPKSSYLKSRRVHCLRRELRVDR